MVYKSQLRSHLFNGEHILRIDIPIIESTVFFCLVNQINGSHKYIASHHIIFHRILTTGKVNMCPLFPYIFILITLFYNWELQVPHITFSDTLHVTKNFTIGSVYICSTLPLDLYTWQCINLEVRPLYLLILTEYNKNKRHSVPVTHA